MAMDYSRMAAPLACSAMLHVAVLQFGWLISVSSSSTAAPWRDPGALRATLRPAARLPVPVTAPAPAPVARPIVSPQPPDSETVASAAPHPAQVPAPAAPAPQPAGETTPVAPEPAAPAQPETAVPAQPAAAEPAAVPDDSSFLDAGGVDEAAEPLRQPDFYLPYGRPTLGGWKVQFDLLIDAQGKVVRVENVSLGAPRDVIGAVLAAFYETPFKPAKLAGQPVPIRQRFEVNP